MSVNDSTSYQMLHYRKPKASLALFKIHDNTETTAFHNGNPFTKGEKYYCYKIQYYCCC